MTGQKTARQVKRGPVQTRWEPHAQIYITDYHHVIHFMFGYWFICIRVHFSAQIPSKEDSCPNFDFTTCIITDDG